MKKKMKKLITLFLFVCLITFQESVAQNNSEERKKETNAAFTVRGEIRGKTNRTPVSEATIRIVGGEVVKTNAFGRFTIRTRVGDQLVIEHPSFGTEFHVISSEEPLVVLVDGFDEKNSETQKQKSVTNLKRHKVLLDSAVMFKKKDIDKSIQYIEKALENLYDNNDQKQLSDSYTILGDIYAYWKQYDLAISNYQIALNMYSTSRLWISLGTTQLLNEQYKEELFLSIPFYEITYLDISKLQYLKV